MAKEVLAEQGIDLEVVEFSDYVQPNLVTESGEVDANYFSTPLPRQLQRGERYPSGQRRRGPL